MAGKRRKCVCGCGRTFLPGETVRRGLKPSCYQLARQKVAAKETTWAKLEAAGVAAPSAKNQPRSPMGKKLAALTRG